MEMPADSLAFVFALAIVSMRIQIGNGVLCWCGEHLFAIYILQRIPMNVLKGVKYISETPPVYFAICLAVTAVLAFLFDRAMGKLDEVLGLK
jgi:adenosine/AMP kinase